MPFLFGDGLVKVVRAQQLACRFNSASVRRSDSSNYHNLFYKRVYVPAARAAFPERTRLAEQEAVRAAEAKGEEPPTKAQLKNVSPFRFHDLRHTCAAWLIDGGAHRLQIKLRLGHKSIKTTMDTYGHLFPSAEPELADLFDAGYRSAQDNVTPLRAADDEEPPEEAAGAR